MARKGGDVHPCRLPRVPHARSKLEGSAHRASLRTLICVPGGACERALSRAYSGRRARPRPRTARDAHRSAEAAPRATPRLMKGRPSRSPPPPQPSAAAPRSRTSRPPPAGARRTSSAF
eukprot:scaffold820_cov104-Isochrysis_galbana.AAC.5